MTATTPDMISFLESTGLPRTTEATKTFTEVSEPVRLSYTSLVDFVPGHEPYEHLTVVDLEPRGDATHVVMTVERLHDDEWTDRLVTGRSNELDNLAAAIARRS